MFETALSKGAALAMVVIGGVVLLWVLFRVTKKITLTLSEDIGASFVLKTRDVKKAYDTYLDLKTKRGAKGMVISRVFPDRLRQKYGMGDSTFLWLSFEKVKDTIEPNDLEKLEFLIHEFITSYKNAVILLDGVEYLVLQNTFENTLKFLQSLNDQIILRNAILIVPLTPESLDKKELSLLERELESFQVDYRLLRFFE